MKLYTFDMAPNPRRLGLFLAYKGVKLDTEQVDMMKQEQLSESFRAINPRCSVPVLRLEDGTVLCDVVSICLYLDEQFPDRTLMGRNALERAQVVGWMHRIFMEGLLAVAEILRNQGEAFKGRALPGPLDLEQIPELVERGRKRLRAFLADMDQSLAERDFLVGDSLSQADIDLKATCDFCAWVKEGVPESCTHLREYLERVTAELGE